MKRVRIHSETALLDDFFCVNEVLVSYERYSGEMSRPVRRLCFERGDSVAALVFNRDTRRILLIEQFRYAAYKKGPGWITEVVAGILSQDETPEEALRREVLEEIGYKIDELHFIAGFYLSPGGSSERTMLYYAEVTNGDRIVPGGGLMEGGEDIRTVEYTLDELRDEILFARIQDAKTIIAIMWLLLQGQADTQTEG